MENGNNPNNWNKTVISWISLGNYLVFILYHMKHIWRIDWNYSILRK